MFLNQLSLEEKKAFVALAKLSAESNGEVTVEENAMIEAYCKEMEIDSNVDLRDFQDIIDTFGSSSDKHKRIIILETLGLLHADGSLDEKEEALLSELANGIGVSNDKVDELQQAIEQYLEVIKTIVTAIETV